MSEDARSTSTQDPEFAVNANGEVVPVEDLPHVPGKELELYHPRELDVFEDDRHDEAAIDLLPPPKALKLAFVDMSHELRQASRQYAETRLNQDLEEGNGFRKILKRTWKNNIARDYYIDKYRREYHERVGSADDIYELLGSSDEASRQAMESTVERIMSEDPRFISTEAGESVTAITGNTEVDNQIRQEVTELILAHARGDLQDPEDFIEARNRVLKNIDKLNGSLFEDALMFTDNMLEISETVRAMLEHDDGLARAEEALSNMRILAGVARPGVRQEAYYSKFDSVMDRMHAGRIGGTGLATAIGIGGAIVFAGSKRAATSTTGTALRVTGIGAGAAGVLAAVRERYILKREKSFVQREAAMGIERYDSANPRRLEMQKTVYESIEAVAVTAQLADLVDENGDLRNDLTNEELLEAVNVVAQARSRLEQSDRMGIDLIRFSGPAEVASERFAMLQALVASEAALARSDITLTIGEDDGSQTALALHEAQRFAESAQYRQIDEEVKLTDSVTRKLEAKRMAIAFAAGATAGLVIGAVAQEGVAAISDSRSGVFEGSPSGSEHATLLSAIIHNDQIGNSTSSGAALEAPYGEQTYTANRGNVHLEVPKGIQVDFDNNHQADLVDRATGKTVFDNVQFNKHGKLTPDSVALLNSQGISADSQQHQVDVGHRKISHSAFLEQNKDDITKINRQLWYDNDTTNIYDKNELGLHAGGSDKSGGWFNGKGNVVIDVTSMTKGGSYNDGLSANAHALAESGDLKMSVIADYNHQSKAMLFDFQKVGDRYVAVIPKDHPAHQFFSYDSDGHRKFTGAFTEVLQSRGKGSGGALDVRPLATLEGTRGPVYGVSTETITNTRLNFAPIPVVAAESPDVLPVFGPPIYPRRGVGAARRMRETDPYYAGPGYINYEQRRSWERQRSPRLLADSDAVLNPGEELSWYRQRQQESRGGGYLGEIDGYISNSSELSSLPAETRAIVCMPVAAVAESENIYKTLSLYAQQQGASSGQFTVLLNVNWIDDAENDPDKKAAIEKTLSEIERARADFPDLRVAHFTKVWNRDWVDNERNGKMYGEVIKVLYDTAALATERGIREGRLSADQDMLIVTNDADAQGLNKHYVERYINAIEQSPDSDAFVGMIRWGTEEFQDYPGYGVTVGVMQALNAVATRDSEYGVSAATIGPNAAFRMSMYAAVGGCEDRKDAGAGADSELGRKVLAARGAGSSERARKPYGGYSTRKPRSASTKLKKERKVIKHVGGADVDSAADRLLIAYRSDKWLPSAWGGFDNGGYQARDARGSEELIEPEDVAGDWPAVSTRIERQISDFVTHWYPDERLARWGLSVLFPGTGRSPAFDLTASSNGQGSSKSTQYTFKLTKSGSAWLQRRLLRDARGRNYGLRVQERLYKAGRLARP